MITVKEYNKLLRFKKKLFHWNKVELKDVQDLEDFIRVQLSLGDDKFLKLWRIFKEIKKDGKVDEIEKIVLSNEIDEILKYLKVDAMIQKVISYIGFFTIISLMIYQLLKFI